MTTIPEIDLDPFADEVLIDPYRYHAELRDIGPVFRLNRYGVYGMARYADVTRALKDWTRFCSSRGVGMTDYAHEPPRRPPSPLIESDPPLHDRTRKVMNQIVSMDALRAVRPRWTQAAEELVESLVTRRRFDAVTELAEIFPQFVIPDMVGLRDDGRENMLPWALATFNALGPNNQRTQETLAQAADSMSWVRDACRRENLRADGWGMAIYAAADRGECTLEQAQLMVRSFITAGLDTTINGIGNLLLAFAQFPAEWARLRQDPTRVPRAIEESLRWDSTAQTFFRTTTQAVEIEDYCIPEGSKVLLFLASANRDPRRWNDPDRFDITRVTGGHVAFGFGIHQCLGQMVARQEMQLILDALVSRVATLRMTGPAQRRLNNTLRALSSLPLEVEPV